MPMRIRQNTVRFRQRLTLAIESDWPEDLEAAGSAAADAIVSTTLEGTGAGDVEFEPYSDSYAARKGQENVDLRGAYFHNESQIAQHAKLNRRWRGFETTNKTVERPSRSRSGIYDPNSEMSRDLIHVEATGNSVRLRYRSRNDPYMFYHNQGIGNLPRRPWFSMNKTDVKGAAFEVLRERWRERIGKFNSGV